MQAPDPPPDPPSVSMGVEEGSNSGKSEATVKREAKRSIVVYVARELRDAMELCEVERLLNGLLLYFVSLS
jgi:hypothetical protein